MVLVNEVRGNSSLILIIANFAAYAALIPYFRKRALQQAAIVLGREDSHGASFRNASVVISNDLVTESVCPTPQ